ncbi:hypothetical protein CYMTET_11175 [Cymbomonas tetramitiformis]|uniref:Uncharacterized protein n=1 Tax=Cymbomonas tetramitiformis TaxID=36881 RepID=A0AAE0LD96_9CHLO|nr:hypothetical protein CYMTET_11175 [Cymbomonas tetramitiformis]
MVHAMPAPSYDGVTINSAVNGEICSGDGVMVSLTPGTDIVSLLVFVVGMEFISTEYQMFVTREPGASNPLLAALDSYPALSSSSGDFFALDPPFDPATTYYQLSLPYNNMWLELQPGVSDASLYGVRVDGQALVGDGNASMYAKVTFSQYGYSTAQIELYSLSDASQAALTTYILDVFVASPPPPSPPHLALRLLPAHPFHRLHPPHLPTIAAATQSSALTLPSSTSQSLHHPPPHPPPSHPHPHPDCPNNVTNHWTYHVTNGAAHYFPNSWTNNFPHLHPNFSPFSITHAFSLNLSNQITHSIPNV